MLTPDTRTPYVARQQAERRRYADPGSPRPIISTSRDRADLKPDDLPWRSDKAPIDVTGAYRDVRGGLLLAILIGIGLWTLAAMFGRGLLMAWGWL